MPPRNNQPRVVLPGSERQAILGGVSTGPANQSERITVTVHVRRSEEPQPITPSERILSREEFAATHGAAPNDLRSVREFAQNYGLEVVAESPVNRSLELAGTVAAMSAAFGVTLENVRVGENTYRQRVGAITLPAELAPIVVAVLGLDNRPQASPRYGSIDTKSAVLR
jgi:kumamolisin